jgi:hypothetical protein
VTPKFVWLRMGSSGYDHSDCIKVVPVFTWLSTTPRRRMGEWKYTSTNLELGNIWWWVVSFKARPLYPRGRSPRYPLNKTMDGPQIWSGRRREEKYLTPNTTRAPTPSAVQLVASRYIYCDNPAPHERLIRTKLNPPSRVILENLLVLFSQSRNFLPFMESEGSFIIVFTRARHSLASTAKQ